MGLKCGVSSREQDDFPSCTPEFSAFLTRKSVCVPLVGCFCGWAFFKLVQLLLPFQRLGSKYMCHRV